MIHARKTRDEPNVERLISALQAIAEMTINDSTNHAELTALMKAVAAIALREWCCGDAACYNESSGVGCAIVAEGGSEAALWERVSR